jgi:hypothetical protein
LCVFYLLLYFLSAPPPAPAPAPASVSSLFLCLVTSSVVLLVSSCIAPRDFCLLRYWRSNNDGSYVLCLDSTTHTDCPPLENHVRGDLHGAYVIAPPKSKSASHHHNAKEDDDEPNECLISLIAQVDPKGWLWNCYGYKHAFLREVSSQLPPFLSPFLSFLVLIPPFYCFVHFCFSVFDFFFLS